MFDLFLFPLHLKSGREQASLPGLLVTPAPRRVHRNRAQETLILHLAVISGNPLPLVSEEWLQQAASNYFSTRGLATAAMKAAADHLNQVILDHNLKGSNAGNHMNLALNMAVLRGRLLYLGQSGKALSMFLTGSEVATIPELQPEIPPMGTSRNIELRFTPLEVTAGSILLTGASLPVGWRQETLADTSTLSLEQARRRLLLQGGSELAVQFIQFQPGKGVIHRLKPRASPGAASDVSPPGEPSTAAAEIPPSPVVSPPAEPAGAPGAAHQDLPTDPFPEAANEQADTSLPIVPPFIEETPPAQQKPTPEPPAPTTTLPGETPGLPREQDVANPPPTSQSFLNVPASSEEIILPDLETDAGMDMAAARLKLEADQEVRSAAQEPARLRPRPDQQRPAKTKKKITLPRLPKLPPSLLLQLSHAWHAFKGIFGKAGGAIKRFLPRMLPEGENLSLSPGAMLFIALAVPVLVVAVATTVYFRTGRSEQHLQYLGQAAASAAQAGEAGDAATQRLAWQQALTWLEAAERYGQTEESRLLRDQITDSLDRLDKVYRLYYQPAIAVGFDKNLRFSNVAVTDSEIFLLESGQSRIYRLFLTGTGYQLDPDFDCNASTMPKTTVIGSLVDLVAIPPNALNASVMAVDAAGTLMYCGTGIQPALQYLPQPDTGWGGISAMTLNAGGLYLLDVPANAVWTFAYGTSGLGENLRLFFDDQVPQMNDMIDLAVYNENLYLLHADGRMAACLNRTFTLSKATCTDPAPFGDLREGEPPEVLVFPDTSFIQLTTTDPPDPSVYVLDGASNSMYHFSLRLNLQRLLRPAESGDFPLPDKQLTAFAITPGRIAVFAFGNEVFLAEMP